MRPALRPLAVSLLLGGLQLLAVLNPDVVEPDPEELYNASHAFEVAHGHLKDAFRLQYRPFCGGCTLDALLAAPLFALLSPRWVVWKLVPLLYLWLLLGVVWRRLPSPGREAYAVLLLFPPATFLSLSSVAWGNHYEAGVLAGAGLLLLACAPRSSFLAGLVLGGAVWVGFAGAFSLPAAVLWLLLRREGARLPRLGAGALVGVSPWLLLWLSAGITPFGEIYGAGEALPSLAHIPAQAETLLHPRQVAALLGHPWLGLAGLPVVGAWAGAAAVAHRHPVGQIALLGLACWAGIYLLSGFHIPLPPDALLPAPASLRYLAPVFPLLFLLMAAAILTLEAHPAPRPVRRRRQLALLAAPLLIGGLSRVSTVVSPFPVWEAWTMVALDHDRAFRQQGTYALSRTAHRACRAEDPRSRQLHAYAIGHLAAEVAFEGHFDPVMALKGFGAPYGVDAEGFYSGAAACLMDRLDSEGNGSLEAMEAGLMATEGWPEEARRELLRVRANAVWLGLAMESHDEAAVERLIAVLAEQPAEVWWLVGWRWGEDISRPLLPTPDVALPILPPARIPATFAEGLGEALGERWGGVERLPLNLPEAWRSPFVEGYQEGRARRW